MRWIIAFGVVMLVSVRPAHAQSTSGTICAAYEASWAKVAAGRNLAAMDQALANIPQMCSDLRDRAERRRGEVSSAAAPAPRRTASARTDPQLKTAYQMMDWVCANISTAGFDLEKSYASFPADKLTLQPVKVEAREDQREVVSQTASGLLYKVEYRFQRKVGEAGYGFNVHLQSADVMSPIMTGPDAFKKFLSAYGTVENGLLGPTVGFGPLSPVLSRYPLDIMVWNNIGLINVEWFSPAGLAYAGSMCKK